MRKYGFLVIFLVLFLGSLFGFAVEDREHAKDEHQERCDMAQGIVEAIDSEAEYQCESFVYDDSSFWDGFWENMQSEWAQLFMQGLILVALQQLLAQKDSENTIDDVRTALRRNTARK